MRAPMIIAGAALLAACVATPLPPDDEEVPLAVGQGEWMELYAIRFDVQDFEQVVTKQTVLDLPQSVRDNLWLYNLDLTGKSGTPRLLDNSMQQIRELDPNDESLSQAEANMIKLLNMTPDTADLRGTNMEELTELAPKVGFAAPEVLAQAAGIQPDDPFLTDSALTAALLENVISTHPNARWRRGRVTPEHPDGKHPVPFGFLPVTLEDAASDMESGTRRFGPYDQDGQFHPGFLTGTVKAQLLRDDFAMTIKASTNALPFKGIDLSHASVGSVPSIGNDAGQLFDFSDPEWITIEGLNEDLKIERLGFQILEHPEFLDPGVGPMPLPWGNSPVWRAPKWTLERVVADATLQLFATRLYEEAYFLGDSPDPLFTVAIDDGWLEIVTKGNIGSPPIPLYMWDFMVQVMQVRLHDGPDPTQPEVGAIPEGEANVRFDLHDVELGVTVDQITEAIKRNLEEDPTGLISAASLILDQSYGAPDIYYYRPRPSGDVDPGDWLFYIVEDDIPLDDNGDPVREPANYQRPGFYSDADLSDKVSSTEAVDGDTVHEKVRVQLGDVLYTGDDTGNVYRLEVGAKPSRATIRLKVERIR